MLRQHIRILLLKNILVFLENMFVLVVLQVVGVTYAANTVFVFTAYINARAPIINGFLKFWEEGFLDL